MFSPWVSALGKPGHRWLLCALPAVLAARSAHVVLSIQRLFLHLHLLSPIQPSKKPQMLKLLSEAGLVDATESTWTLASRKSDFVSWFSHF